jgi:mannose-1-phosphate guanylyltransferase/mannose-1-phosphate guanylyltransferase/mannose-6-phosphate isomerase
LLSGGAGSRLWPLSRQQRPKHLVLADAGRTLFQQAASRALSRGVFEPLTVIANQQQGAELAEQLSNIGISSATIVLEPSPRNTAAAAATAALLISRVDPEGVLLLMPVDQRITDPEAFRHAVQAAIKAASTGLLVLFGIRPTAPKSGYGYVRVGAPVAGSEPARKVDAFVEKPGRADAERYLEGGDYLWNSGIFLLLARVLLAELAHHAPEILGCARAALDRSTRDDGFLQLDGEAFERCPAVSIDHAVMEHTKRAAVIPVDFEWSDVGSWSVLWELADRDAAGNSLLGEVLAEATTNSYIRSEGPLVATIGVDELIVVATDDAVLVARKDRDQDIGKIVERLRDGNRGRT